MIATLLLLRRILDLLSEGGCAVAPEPCRVAVYPGAEVPWETFTVDCAGGRDGQLYAALQGTNVTNYGGGCRRITFTAVIGIARCAATLTNSGDAPSVEQVEADAVQQASDAEAIMRALTCCEDRPEDVELVSWAPIGPSGAAAGGEWTIRGVIEECC